VSGPTIHISCRSVDETASPFLPEVVERFNTNHIVSNELLLKPRSESCLNLKGYFQELVPCSLADDMQSSAAPAYRRLPLPLHCGGYTLFSLGM
jgi:hypothetical protein